jgi:shikimate kinase
LDYILVPVYSSGGGTAEWEEIFIFTSKNGKIIFLKCTLLLI